MRVAIAGAGGKVARELAAQLVARGDEVVGLVRRPEQVQELRSPGVEPVACDLEHAPLEEVAAALQGADAAVFAAGAGAGSGAERKLSMDRDGAIKLLEACQQAGARRYVMLSAVGADDPPQDDEVFSVYLRAKAEADAAVGASDRDWTILRPGRLTDEQGSGHVSLSRVPFRGEIPRSDVAGVIAAVLAEPRTSGLTLYLNSGEEPVAEAVEGAGAAASSGY